nr:uncharacterized protein LOC113396058 [Vanessa tameamea]
MKFALTFLTLVALSYSAPQPRKLFHEHFEDFKEVISKEVDHELKYLVEHYLEFEEFRASLDYIGSDDFKKLIFKMEELPEFEAVIDFLESNNLDMQYFLDAFSTNLEYVQRGNLRHEVSGRDMSSLIRDCTNIYPKSKLAALYEEKLAEDDDFRRAMESFETEEWDKLYTALWENETFLKEVETLKENGIEVSVSNDDLTTNINVKRIRTRDIKQQRNNETTSKSKWSDERMLKSTKTLCIENNITNKLEKDLYDDTFKKDNNINERSSILIKQIARQSLGNRFVVHVMPKLNNDVKTRATYSLNRNNGFDEFHRRVSVGITNPHKNVDDSNLRLNKPENQYTIPKDMGFTRIYDGNFKNNNSRSYSRGQRKYLVSYIRPFLKPYIEIASKATEVTLKPEVHHFRNMVVQQRILQSISNKNPFKLAYPGGKTIDTIDNLNNGIILINDNKKLSNGNSNDGQKSVDRIIKTNSIDQAFVTENNGRLDRFGLHNCPNCGENIFKEYSNSRMMKVAIAFLALVAVACSAPQPRVLFHEHFEEFSRLIGDEAADDLNHLVEHYLEFEEFQMSLDYLITPNFRNLVYEMEDLPEFKAVVEYLETHYIDINYFINAINNFVDDVQRRTLRHEVSGRDMSSFIKDSIDAFPKAKLTALYEQKMAEDDLFRNAMESFETEEWKELYSALWQNETFLKEVEILKENGIDVEIVLLEAQAVLGIY